MTFFAVAAMNGCTGVGESTQEETPADTLRAEPQAGFETRTDTVLTKQINRDDGTGAGIPASRIKYTIQIGAFKDPVKASKIQQTAKERYKLPVVNNFYKSSEMYQIRIGRFASREAAQAFRERMRKEFPADYKDAWVVQLK